MSKITAAFAIGTKVRYRKQWMTITDNRTGCNHVLRTQQGDFILACVNEDCKHNSLSELLLASTVDVEWLNRPKSTTVEEVEEED